MSVFIVFSKAERPCGLRHRSGTDKRVHWRGGYASVAQSGKAKVRDPSSRGGTRAIRWQAEACVAKESHRIVL